MVRGSGMHVAAVPAFCGLCWVGLRWLADELEAPAPPAYAARQGGAKDRIRLREVHALHGKGMLEGAASGTAGPCAIQVRWVSACYQACLHATWRTLHSAKTHMSSYPHLSSAAPRSRASGLACCSQMCSEHMCTHGRYSLVPLDCLNHPHEQPSSPQQRSDQVTCIWAGNRV